MPKEHAEKLKGLRESALEIADELDQEIRPHSEPPARTGGDMQTYVRRELPRIGEFDPTPQQDMAASLRGLAAAVDRYLEAVEAGSA